MPRKWDFFFSRQNKTWIQFYKSNISNGGFSSGRIYKVVCWAGPMERVCIQSSEKSAVSYLVFLLTQILLNWQSYWCNIRIWELIVCSFTCWSLNSFTVAGGCRACGTPPGLCSAQLLPWIYMHRDERLGCTSEILIVSVPPPANLWGKDKQTSNMKRQVGIFCSYIGNSSVLRIKSCFLC